MKVLTNLIVVITIYMCTLCTLNLHNVKCQLYHNKAGKKRREMSETLHTGIGRLNDDIHIILYYISSRILSCLFVPCCVHPGSTTLSIYSLHLELIPF